MSHPLLSKITFPRDTLKRKSREPCHMPPQITPRVVNGCKIDASAKANAAFTLYALPRSSIGKRIRHVLH